MGYIVPNTPQTLAATPKEDCKNYDLFYFLYTHRSNIQELQILTVDKLVIHRIAIVMYKFYNVLIPAVLNTLYIF